MLNFNGTIINKSNFSLDFNNRGFAYGDAIFDTLKYTNANIEFLEDHYFRLMASMRILRMEIPLSFTKSFFQEEIQKTIVATGITNEARVKFTVFRNSGGLYTPKTNSVSFIVEISQLNITSKDVYTIDLFKDYTVNTNLISTLKTNNKIINVLSSIYAEENGLDACILLNFNKNIVETNNANIFLIFQNKIITPPTSDGCIKGIMRKKVIESIINTGEFIFEETSVSPFDLQKADSVFVTNSIIGIQAVTHYRKKNYNTYLVDMVKSNLDIT